MGNGYVKACGVVPEDMQRAILQKKITDKAKLATIGALCVFNTYGVEMLDCLTDSGRDSFLDFRYRLERSRTESESKTNSARKQDRTEKVSKRFQHETVSFSEEGFTPSTAETVKAHRNTVPTVQVAVKVEGKEEQQAMPCMDESDGATRWVDVAGAVHDTPAEALEASFAARGFSGWSDYCSKVRGECPPGCDGSHAMECFELLMGAIDRCDRSNPWGLTKLILEQDRSF